MFDTRKGNIIREELFKSVLEKDEKNMYVNQWKIVVN